MTALAIENNGSRTLKHGALVGALGIVYGDIGTSPLYAFKESLKSAGNIEALIPVTFGIVSLIFWAIIIVVSIKYVMVVMRATNEGEGGIMALTALAITRINPNKRIYVIYCGLVGVALFYGDCIITPAISVMSAVEGLEIATPIFKPYIVFIVIVVLAALFIIQSRGTAQIGLLFGPIMFAWFATIGAIGFYYAVQEPRVLNAINPKYGLDLIFNHGWTGFHVLGSVFLALTGAEALYADEGHFKGEVIRFDWFSLVLPCLLLNYFGQAAFLMSNPAAVSNPFYLLFPDWMLYPAVGLATMATIIASQAVISGAFTITQQAMHLGFLPRMDVKHTSKTEAAQIYIPQINWFLAVAVIILVMLFKSSDALAGAYGVAVATTMLVTSILVAVVAHTIWKWSRLLTASVTAIFLLVDGAFFTANLVKIPEGGYIPIIIGMGIFFGMTTWFRGRKVLLDHITQDNPKLADFWEQLNCKSLTRVPGTAIYLTTKHDYVPSSMLLNIKHNKCLHQSVILLKVVTERVPFVGIQNRAEFQRLDHGFSKLTLHYGFGETPNVPRSLEYFSKKDIGWNVSFNGSGATYFVGRAIPLASRKAALPSWHEPLFSFLIRNSASSTTFFCIRPEDAVEIGTYVEV